MVKVERGAGGIFNCPDLKELYSREYDDKMLRWRTIGAIGKAQNIEALAGGAQSSIHSVLEVGCGTGSVLEQLAARKIGAEFTGIEIGIERSKEQERDGIHIHGFDGKTIPYPDQSFDLVYATHVLEHVLDERGFLAELRRVTRQFLYIEVPCELTMRTTQRSLQGTLNIGHINPYSPESFALRLETSGLVVAGLRIFDHPYAIHRFSSPAWRSIVKMAIRRGLLNLNRSLACQIFSYHCGALCKPGPSLAI